MKKNAGYSGFSTQYGVTFYGEKHTVASVIDEGKTYVFVKDEIAVEKEKLSKTEIVVGIILYMIIFAISYLFQQLLKLIGIHFIFYTLFTIVIMLRCLKATFQNISKMDLGDTYKFHAAEHMAYNAMYKKGREVTKNEVKEQSRYSRHCGISIISNYMFFVLLSYAQGYFTGFYLPILFLYLMSFCFATVNPFSPLVQFFATTRVPNDKHIEVATSAINVLHFLETHEDYDWEKFHPEWVVPSKNEVLLESDEDCHLRLIEMEDEVFQNPSRLFTSNL